MPGPYNIRTATYTGVNPDPVEWANEDVKPAIEDLHTRVAAVEGAYVPGSVFFEGTAAVGPLLSSGGFNGYPINNIVTNIGGGSFNTSTWIYTIPEDGLYDCQALVRSGDNTNPRSLGIGIGTANTDAPHFQWGSFGGTGSFSRNGTSYRRLTRFNAGDQVRLYIYSDGESFYVNTGYLAILKVGD